MTAPPARSRTTPVTHEACSDGPERLFHAAPHRLDVVEARDVADGVDGLPPGLLDLATHFR
jgi:hypothetical protein